MFFVTGGQLQVQVREVISLPAVRETLEGFRGKHPELFTPCSSWDEARARCDEVCRAYLRYKAGLKPGNRRGQQAGSARLLAALLEEDWDEI